MAWTTPRDWTAGEFVTETIMDTHIRDNLNALGPNTMLMKTADQGLSTTTLTNDTHLVLPVGANEVWKFQMTLLITSNTTADFKYAWSVPAGTTMKQAIPTFGGASHWLRDATGTATQEQILTETGLAVMGTTANQFGLLILGWVFSAGTAGNVTFQWAQVTASGTTTIHRGSCWEARRGI